MKEVEIYKEEFSLIADGLVHSVVDHAHRVPTTPGEVFRLVEVDSEMSPTGRAAERVITHHHSHENTTHFLPIAVPMCEVNMEGWTTV